MLERCVLIGKKGWDMVYKWRCGSLIGPHTIRLQKQDGKKSVDKGGGTWVEVGGVIACETSDCFCFFSLKLDSRAPTENEDGK